MLGMPDNPAALAVAEAAEHAIMAASADQELAAVLPTAREVRIVFDDGGDITVTVTPDEGSPVTATVAAPSTGASP